MDGVSLGIGVVGLAMQCFSAITTFIMLIQDLKDIDSKSALLRCKLQIEQHLLLAWGREHGLMDGTLDKRVPDETCRRLILVVLRNMRGLVAETDELLARYGLHHVSQLSGNVAGVSVNDQTRLGSSVQAQCSSSVPIAADLTAMSISEAHEQDSDSIELDMYGKRTLAKWKIPSYFQSSKKWKWLIKDSNRFNTLVDHLRYFNQSLDRLTNSRKSTLLGAGSSLIAESMSSPANLHIIETASAAVYPELSVAASIGRRTAEVEARDAGSISNVTSTSAQITTTPQRALRISPVQVKLSHKSASKVLTTGTYNSPFLGERSILVQWRPFQSPLKAETLDKTTRRIEDTALILSSQNQWSAQSGQTAIQSLSLLDCLGYMVDDLRLGYVFSIPLTAPPDRTPRTLLQLLSNNNNTPSSRYGIPPPPLEVRIQLAQKLCTTLYWLHVSGLVHKGIRSDNILLFRTNQHQHQHGGGSDPLISSPFLVGFDHSRRDDDANTVTRTSSTPEQDLYRHPDFLSSATKRSTKLHDIYSLGLVLLEIGSWFPLSQLAGDTGSSSSSSSSTKADDMAAGRWGPQSYLLKDGGPVAQLAYRAGTRYMEIVRTCLRGSFDVADDDLAGTAVHVAFRNEVVEELDKISV